MENAYWNEDLQLTLDDLADDNPNWSNKALVRDSHSWNLMLGTLALAQNKASVGEGVRSPFTKLIAIHINMLALYKWRTQDAQQLFITAYYY